MEESEKDKEFRSFLNALDHSKCFKPFIRSTVSILKEVCISRKYDLPFLVHVLQTRNGKFITLRNGLDRVEKTINGEKEFMVIPNRSDIPYFREKMENAWKLLSCLDTIDRDIERDEKNG